MIVRLTGGLGNQLFQYAFGRAESLRRNESVKFHWMRSTWDYALDKFNVLVDMNNSLFFTSVYNEKTFAFDKDTLSAPPNTYFSGYWQTEKYFESIKDLLKQEITLKEIRPEVQELGMRLRGEGFTFIHIRRGDYLNPGTAAYHGNLGHASLSDGYYKTAIEYMNTKDEGYFNPIVFSDDPDWCKQNLPFPVITGFSQHEDLYLMSKCMHGIGANSTFSWWANWLGEYPGRVCIAPKKWFNAEADTSDVIPERWIRL